MQSRQIPPVRLRARLATRLRGLRSEPVTATFLVTSPAHRVVRAQLYAAGADFYDDRVATFDWAFTVRTRARAWQRVTTLCRENLVQLQIA